MCGILGYINLDNKNVKNFQIDKLLKTLKHRGPDSTKYVQSKNCYFGHTRLSIIGLKEKKALQPVVRGNNILIFNGEIYNYKKISKNLTKEGIVDSGKSDTETLFNCLKFYGLHKTLSMIDGMYAFAYYDKANDTIYIARDKIGEKPLYWAKNSKAFIFASEIKTIFYSNVIKNEPNINKFHEILLNGKISGAETAFSKIYELEPGTYLKLNTKNNSYQIKNYWNIEDFDVLETNNINDEFHNKLNECVESRLISDVPVGSLISGGIDSSSLVFKMLEIGNLNEIKLFFAQNKIEKINEIEAVKFFYNFLKNKFNNKKIGLRILKNKISDYWKNMEKVAYYNDEPCVFNNFHLVYSLSKMIRNDNLKVIFSGEGADEIFFGYDRFRRTDLSFKNNAKNKNLENIFFGYGIKNLSMIHSILNDKYIDQKIKSSESWSWLNKISKKFDLNTTQILFSQKNRLLGLLQRQDRAAMANGVESRAPFLMPSFVKWINSIPISYKYKRNTNINKIILRNYMSNYLHNNIVNRKKIGFGNDFSHEFKKSDFQKKFISIITEKDSFTSNYLNSKAIIDIFRYKKLIYKHQSIIRAILNTEIWYKVFFRKNYFASIK